MGEDTRWAVGEILNWTAAHFHRKGVESPRLDAEVLLAHSLKIKRIDLYIRHNEFPEKENIADFKKLIEERVRGCPVAYLVGKKEFYGLEFQVGPSVLIPRPDTECLVDAALRLAKNDNWKKVLDLGTGSGCIAITLAKLLPEINVTAVDISEEALAIAKANSLALDVSDKVRFLHGDLFSVLEPNETFDAILSNPPYIPRGDLAGLEAGVRDYEPKLALDGGINGFETFELIIRGAQNHLIPGGALLIEIGSPQEIGAKERLATMPVFKLRGILKDGSGHPRVLHAQLENEKG